jgi:hypothetical protein
MAVTAFRANNGIIATRLPFVRVDGTNAPTQIVQDYLERELKIELHSTQEKSLVSALTEPAKYLDAREASLKEIAKDLAGPYQESQNYYFKVGYPVDEAIALSNIEAKALYDIRLQRLNITNPGADVLITGAINQQTGKIKEAALINGNGKDKKYYKAKYKKKAQNTA